MKYLRYILLTVILLSIQIFFIQRMWTGLYISIYIAIVLLMDIGVKQWIVLLLGFFLGCIVDILSAGAGLNAAATGLVAFCRPNILRMTIPNEILEAKGPILSSRVSTKNFLVYVATSFALWSLMFFSFEIGFMYPVKILIRTLVNVVCGTFLVYIFQLPIRLWK